MTMRSHDPRPTRATGERHEEGNVAVIDRSRPPQVWSVYGAKGAQPVATARKWLRSENGSNMPIGNRWQPTATVSQRMVRSTFATACHRLPTIPFLLERGSTFWLRKEIESREPEGPQDSMPALSTLAASVVASGGVW
jgi:hypothetical protein